MVWDNTLSGALFVNDDKRTDNHPDYKGQIETVDGEKFWVSAWIKEIKSGKNIGKSFLSLALTPKDADDAPRKPQRQQSAKPSPEDFLNRNRANIDRHKDRLNNRDERSPPPIDDFDDSDIPF